MELQGQLDKDFPEVETNSLAEKVMKTEQDFQGNPLDKQIGGAHYKTMSIQPVEYIYANNLGFLEGNVVKYIARHHAKNGADDVRKAIHYCELLLKLKYGDKS